MIRVVLTGGPGAGKSTVTKRLAERAPGRIAVVPEAASTVYQQHNTRWDLLDIKQRRDIQRRIYRLQLQRESAPLSDGSTPKFLVLDRGTIDGAAYWPEGPEEYWKDLKTSHAAELARYDAVIWLETGAILGIYDGGSSNPVRFETSTQAVENGLYLAELWSGHPKFFRVSAYPTIDEKIEQVRSVLESLGKPAK
jgi:predicted ATPase